MAKNFIEDGIELTLLESGLVHPSHADGLADANDPAGQGILVGVVLVSALASTDGIAMDTKGVFTLSVQAKNQSGNSAVAIGDQLYLDLAAANATGTLTSTGTAPSDGNTVTIGSTVYTFKTALTPTAFEVLIGGSAAAALTNLKSAINLTGTPGTDYAAATTIHPTVTGTTLTATTLVVAAKTAGTAGNAIATTEVSLQLSWGTATLTGGTDAGTVNKNSTKTKFGAALAAVTTGATAAIAVRLNAAGGY